MKKHLLCIFSIALIISLFSYTKDGNAQTDGTLTFTFNQPQPGTATKNVLAVWIESATGTFIKTKMRYWGSGTNDHLPTWVSKSGQNVTDANTGVTRTASTSPTAWGIKTVTWDGKNVSGTSNGVTVADGSYKVWIESAYSPNPPANQHSMITSYTFTKGPNVEHLTPADASLITGVVIDWVPATSSVSNSDLNQGVSVFPNPATDILYIDFKESYSECKISIENDLGQTVYSEKPTQVNTGLKSIDVSKYSKGIYFINIQAKDQIAKYKVVLK